MTPIRLFAVAILFAATAAPALACSSSDGCGDQRTPRSEEPAPPHSDIKGKANDKIAPMSNTTGEAKPQPIPVLGTKTACSSDDCNRTP